LLKISSVTLALVEVIVEALSLTSRKTGACANACYYFIMFVCTIL